MNHTYPEILRNRKQRIARRLDPKRRWEAQPRPMMNGRNIHFEMAQRGRAIGCGGEPPLTLRTRGLNRKVEQR
jgi:hypothetical protein